MEIKELMQAVQIEGAGQGDVVFISALPEMSIEDFSKFAEASRALVDAALKNGEYFPRCVIMPPGVTVEVARAQLQDQIKIDEAAPVAGNFAASPDAGFRHG